MPGLSLGLGLGLARARAGGAAAPSAPAGVLLSTYELIDDTNTAFATLFMVGGTEPATFAIQGAAGAYSITGDQLSADGSQTAGTDNITIQVTDANGLTYDQAVALTVSATITPPFQPPAEDPPVIPDPEDPEFDGGGYTQTPVSSTTSEGFKVTGKNGGAAHLLLNWGVPLANAVYTMRYSADWSGMSRLGREAAVGFGFKQNNSFHMAGIRGNGSSPTTMLKSKVHGDFRKANQFTITNDGAATHGTKDGPNWVQIAISSNGATYTLRTSSDGVSWSDQYTGAVPTPLSNATDALQFGPAAYFTNQDKGAFQITFEEYEASDVTAPTLTNAVDTATGQTTASLSVDTDEGNGTLYWVVTTSSTKPSKAQVKAGQNHLGAAAAASGSQAVSSTGTKNASATGLTASTAYFAHFMHEDAAANQSTVVSGDGFTTSAGNGIAVAFAAMQTAGGLQDITTTELNGLTPKAALFFWSWTVSLETSSTIAHHGFGATDGSGQWACAASKAHNLAANDSRQLSTACIARHSSTATSSGIAEFSAFIPDGIRINWTEAPSGGRLMVIFFAGGDLTVDCGTIATPSTSGTAVDVGFQPECVFVGSANKTFGAGFSSEYSLSFGVSHKNGASYDQRASFSRRYSGTSVTTHGVSGAVAGEGSAPSAAYTATCDGFSSTGFTFTPSAAAGSSDDFGYLAISYGGAASYKVGTWSLPTATGNQAKTGVGFASDLVLAGHHKAAINTQNNSTPLISGMTCFTPTATGSHAAAFNGGNAAANNSSSIDSLYAPNADGTVLVAADLVSMDADGWTFNFTTAPSARDFWYWAVNIN